MFTEKNMDRLAFVLSEVTDDPAILGDTASKLPYHELGQSITAAMVRREQDGALGVFHEWLSAHERKRDMEDTEVEDESPVEEKGLPKATKKLITEIIGLRKKMKVKHDLKVLYKLYEKIDELEELA